MVVSRASGTLRASRLRHAQFMHIFEDIRRMFIDFYGFFIKDGILRNHRKFKSEFGLGSAIFGISDVDLAEKLCFSIVRGSFL